MRRVQIPRTELSVSPICLGSGEFGAGVPEDQTFALLDAFVAAGGNFLDTALVYSDWHPGTKSVSEKTLGRWLKQRGNRDQIVLATKGAHPELATMHISRLAPEDIRGDVDKSLSHFQTDVIDLYWLHRDDIRRPVSEIIDALEGVVSAGKIRYYGCSNWTIERIAEAQDYAASRGSIGFAANQPLWSLAEPNVSAISDKTLVVMDKAGIDFHRRTEMPVIPYSSQAHGFFTKMDAQGQAGLSKGDAVVYLNDANLRRLKIVQEMARAHQTSVGAVALSSLCSQPFVTVPVVGCKRIDHLRDSLQAVDLHLTAEEVVSLAMV